MSELKVIINPPNSPAAVDVVLVHGWLGNQQAWTSVSENEHIFWPEHLLPGDTPQARILAFEYNANISRFWSLDSEIDSISEDLLYELIDKRSTSEAVKRPIIFVAHSIGGLVCQAALVRASNGEESQKDLANRVLRIAFLGTPSLGNDLEQWSKMGENFLKLSGEAAEHDMKKASEKLVVLGTKFPDLLKSRSQTPETRLEAVCFYEGSFTDIGGSKLKIVEEPATRIPDCPLPSRLDASHQGMCVYKSKCDENYKRVSRRLKKWASDLAVQKDAESQGIVSNATFSGSHNAGVQLGFNNGTLSGFHFGVTK